MSIFGATKNQMLSVPFTTTTAQAVGATDATIYRAVTVQITSQGTSSTVNFQGSNDNSTWVSVAMTISTSVTTAPVVNTTSVASYYAPLHFKYFRLNVTGITAGKTAGIIIFSTTYSDTNPITSTAVTVAAAATNIAKAEDGASASADVGVPAYQIRRDTPVVNANVSADGDYMPLIGDNKGNLRTASKIYDSWGDNLGSTMLDQLLVASPNRLAGGVFNGSTPDGNFFISSITGGATATISGNELNLAVTTTSGSSILAHTQSLARYMGASMNGFRTIARLGDTGKTNNTRQWGIINGSGPNTVSTFTDGFFFQLSGTTFSIVSRTASSDTAVNSGSFNGDVTSWTPDTNYHTFEIFYTNKRIDFYIDSVRIHQIQETSAPICNTRHFKPFGRNFNTGVGSVCSLYAQTISITRYGEPSSQAKTYLQQGLTTGVLLKSGPGSIHLLNISGVTNNSVIALYDGTSTSGTMLWTSGAMSNQTVPFTVSLDSSGGTPFEAGLFLTITAANSNVFVKYE